MPPGVKAPTDAKKAELKKIAQNYGGNFGGSGVASYGGFSNPNIQAVQQRQPSQNLFQKLGSVASQTFDVGKSVAGAAANFVVNTPRYIYDGTQPFLQGVADVVTQSKSRELGFIKDQQLQLEANSEKYTQMYKAGKMDKEQYIRLMKDIGDSFQGLSNNAQSIEDYAKTKDTKEVLVSAANTAALILSVGRYKPIGATKAITPTTATIQTFNQATQRMEQAIQHVPAFRELVLRNTDYFANLTAKQLAGESTAQFLARNSKDLAVGLLIKRPVIYETNIGLGEDMFNHLLEGENKGALTDAAWLGVQALGGGPLGWMLRNGKKFGVKVGELARGKGSFIDTISQRIGDRKASQLAEYIAKNPEVEDAWRQAQAVNLHMTNGDVNRAVDNFLRNYESLDATKLTPEYLTKTFTRWNEAFKMAQDVSKKNFPDEALKYVAVRWDTPTKDAFITQATRIIDQSQDLNVRTVQLEKFINEQDFSANELLKAKLMKLLANSKDGAEYAAKVRKIQTASIQTTNISATARKKLAKLGYMLAEPRGGVKTPVFEDTPKLVSAITHGSDMFDPAVAPQPVLATLRYGLGKAGLSPEANTRIAYEKLSDSLANNITELGIAGKVGLTGDEQAKGAQYIISKLQRFIDNQKPNRVANVLTLGKNEQSALQDIRQMTVNELMDALPGIEKNAAKKLQKAIFKAYTDVPLEFRGLGIKAMDYAYRFPGAKLLYRTQSALRYTYNPFFRAQEITETKSLTHMKANNLVWMKPKKELDAAWETIDNAKLFTTGYTGEATQDLTLGRLHANLLGPQKRDLAGLALDMAQKQGKTLEQLIQDSPEQLADALRIIVQYPTKGVLNSSLARTLNIVFFPMRYNLKVAGLVANKVAELPPTVQTAFIHSMFKMSDWLKSDEGIRWQAEHQDAIQLFSYFSVYGNINSVLTSLNKVRQGQAPDSIGELGLLGGLPFGFISQVLDAEGIISLNTPYVNPKTGEVVPDYTPDTTKARAAVAIEGLINNMFTYPGRIIGLPGKTQQTRKLVDTFLNTNGSEYIKHIDTQSLTPLQRKWVEVLQNPNVTEEELDQLFVTPANDAFQWYTLPPPLPGPVHQYTRQEVAALKAARKKSSGGSTRGKKKALPIPARGQTL